MKKLFLIFLFISGLVFGQNVELLQKANSGDETFAQTFTKNIYPDYKLVDSYKEGLNYTYVLVPEKTSEAEVKDCKLGNPCKIGVSVVYKVINGNYVFSSAKGDSESLFAFWTKEVQPAEKTTAIKSYKNKEAKVWYNLEPTPKSWRIVNMSDRSDSQW
ncbi:hypothetical protein AP75_01975 [Kaistella haifensis DSM 19056]|uniref:Uncharacterized protein n=1 Tax=Kaistella haifensis DSM 19056 TaxID=1450526 RepID=A0A246BD24_9FLAO|nr:hypothetical protein [Kaistella haifensis]OWK99279.1 hypothetical protein AP75_01975 [Kaistella haifensis DSM 19056]